MALKRSLTLLCSLLLTEMVAGTPLEMPYYFQRPPTTPCNITAEQVRRELGTNLSNTSSIFGPSDARWPNATARWDILEVPSIQVVVQVGQEEDISKVIKYCNHRGIEFLAVNRGHSISIYSMESFTGVQIDLKQLNGIFLGENGTTATLQAGTYGIEVITVLWDLGYVAATGAHECVGFNGFALGGGHGRYEGQYGLGADSFISLNTVLANGSTITVSEIDHSDLFWAMKGAGHNFGIVTSVQVKVYPHGPTTWHYHNYHWSGDKLETVFERLNFLHNNGSTPIKMGVVFGSFTMNPRFSNTSATLWFSFAYDGPASEAEALLEPFNEIESLNEEVGDVPYTEIPAVQGTSFANGACDPTYKVFTHALLQTYNVSNERQVYDLFNVQAALYPELASATTVYYEGYSTKAVESFVDNSSAYAWRHEYHILYFAASMTDHMLSMKDTAIAWGEEVRDSWNIGRQPATYINYANGNESLESIYGYEPWRLERLRALKTIYDPQNKFRFHVPINPEGNTKVSCA